VATTPLVEGVTPAGNSISNQDYSVQLAQYGDYVTITDVILDTHTDSVLQETTDILGEQAALTVETLRFNVLKAGTNVFYANAVAARANVVAAPVLADQRRVTTALNRQNAKKISSVVASNAGLRHEVGGSCLHGGLPPRPRVGSPQHDGLQAGRGLRTAHQPVRG
jgi:N4-gp56 family major capsid protein